MMGLEVLGIGGMDKFGRFSKLIVSKEGKDRFNFRILVFNDGGIEQDVNVSLESEKVRRVIKFLDGVIE